MSMNARQRRRMRRRANHQSVLDQVEAMPQQDFDLAVERLRAFGLLGTSADGSETIAYSPEEAIANLVADPAIYKTPAGNPVAMFDTETRLFHHWMTTDEVAERGIPTKAIEGETPGMALHWLQKVVEGKV